MGLFTAAAAVVCELKNVQATATAAATSEQAQCNNVALKCLAISVK